MTMVINRVTLNSVTWIDAFVYLILFIQTKAALCPAKNYTLIDKTACYWVTDSAKNQTYSNTECESKSGMLAILRNQQVSNELKGIILFPSGSNDMWIGVNDIEKEGVFKQIDGSPVSWTNWANGQPNDPNIDSLASNDCVNIDINLEWYDDGCDRIKIALCFRDLTEARTTTRTPTVRIENTNPSNTGDSSGTQPTENTTTTATTSQKVETTTMNVMNTSEIMLDIAEKIIVPVVIVGVSIVGAIIVVLIIVFRRKRHQQKQPRDVHVNVHSAISNPQYNTIDTEKIPADYSYSEIKDSESNIVNQNPKKVLDDQPKNLYDHTTMQDNTYDVTDNNKHTPINGIYDDGKKNAKTKESSKVYEEIPQDSFNCVISSSKINAPEVDNIDVYYSSAKDPFDSAENAYGDVAEGEYDLLHKKRNKPNNVTHQIYSHTADDVYDTTNNGRKVDDIGDTYDSTMHGNRNIQNDTYDSTSPGNTSTNINSAYNSIIPEHTNVHLADDTYDTKAL